MKKLELNRGANRVDDASIIREVRPPGRWLRPVLTVALLIVLAAACWQTYALYFKPRRDQQKFDAVLAAVSATHRRPAYFEALKAKPREQFLLEVFDNLRSPSPGLDEQVRIAGARSALDLAISEGSDEAGLELGKALRDGVFGDMDSPAALREFGRVKRDIEQGVRASESLALYLQAIMLSEGLGVPQDQQAADAAMKRGAERLTGWRLRRAANDVVHGWGFFRQRADPELGARLASLAMDAGDHSAYTIGGSSCFVRSRIDRADRSVSKEGHDAAESAVARANALKLANAHYDDCRRPWISRAAEAGNRSAMADYADALLWEGNLGAAKKWYEASGSERDSSQNYHYGSLQALTALDAEALLRGTKAMWVAFQENKKSEFSRPGLEDNWQLAQALRGANKTLERANIVVAMLVQGELAGTAQETPGRLESIDFLITSYSGRVRPQDTLSVLVGSPSIKERARLIHQAIRSNKTVTEVAAEVQSNRMAALPTKQSAKKNSVLPQSAISASQPDPEQQSRSGRLAGSSRAASGGLSTFAVDNFKGDRDAVVRLYVEGRLPAVRSFYVKLGEKFTETAIAPGMYVMRYRFIGSEDTFEAEKQFVLTESEIAGGRRYSNVSVTLFKQSDGNLSMKKVAPGQF